MKTGKPIELRPQGVVDATARPLHAWQHEKLIHPLRHEYSDRIIISDGQINVNLLNTYIAFEIHSLIYLMITFKLNFFMRINSIFG